MESNNLPAVINSLVDNHDNNNIVVDKIKFDRSNILILGSAIAVGIPVIALLLANPVILGGLTLLELIRYIGLGVKASEEIRDNINYRKRLKELSQTRKVNLQLESGEKKTLKVNIHSIPPLLDSVENNNKILLVLNKENESQVEDYLIVPKKAEGDVYAFLNTLANNEKVFVKNDDIWNIRYNEEFTQLKDFKGLNYVHYLLQNPHKECSLWELNTAINKPDREALYAVADQNANLKSKDDEEKEEIQYKSAPYDEVNEAYKTLNEYKKSLERLDNLIKEAEASNDIDMLLIIDESKRKREILLKEINRINNEIKHKNFDRTTDKKDDEKIRQAISQAYKQFRKTIKTDKTPNLHKHLTRSIVTGNIYKYDPEDSNVSWVLDI
ncbi:MAG: hypothetical protein PHX07_05620 [Candidatus Marinimicrobia bacterium]|jgi:hypothetical protein|nr:hypothetical protein [Candidatus Neomarinimicrobiota bacterium]